MAIFKTDKEDEHVKSMAQIKPMNEDSIPQISGNPSYGAKTKVSPADSNTEMVGLTASQSQTVFKSPKKIHVQP
jgi:hypothetical protein